MIRVSTWADICPPCPVGLSVAGPFSAAARWRGLCEEVSMTIRQWMLAPLLLLGLADAAAAAETSKAKLVGVWRLTAVYDVFADGSRRDTWGAAPQGLAIFSDKGIFSATIVAGDRKPREGGVPSDPVGPVIAYWGTYTVDEAQGRFVTRVEQSSFPQWNGAALTRTIVRLDDDRLEVVAQAIRDPARGEFVPHLAFVRVK
jgi:hypothetical protein